MVAWFEEKDEFQTSTVDASSLSSTTVLYSNMATTPPSYAQMSEMSNKDGR